MQIKEEHFSTILNTMSDGVMITDQNATILSINPAFTKITGYTEDEIIGKNPRILMSGYQDTHFYQQMWQSLKENHFWQGNIKNRRKNGEVYTEWLTINTITNDDNEIINFVSVLSDVTEHEKIQRDIQLTGKIQMSSLPSECRNDYFHIKTIFKPLRYVSGDYFDLFWDPRKAILQGYIMDFMGHGLATAVQGSAIKVLVNQVLSNNGSLAEKVSWINNESMKYFAEETFAAALFFEINILEMKMKITSAGINYFYTDVNNKRHLHKIPGTFLGIIKDAPYEQHVYPLLANEKIYFLSDGLQEILPNQFNTRLNTFFNTVEGLKDLSNSDRCRDDASAICISIK